MAIGSKQRFTTNRSESGLGVIQYFVIGGAGIAIAAIALTEGQVPFPQISSDKFEQPSQSATPRSATKLDRDFKPTEEAVARVHQSDIVVAYEGGNGEAIAAPQIAQREQSIVAPAANTSAPQANAPQALASDMSASEARVGADGIALGTRLSVIELTEEFELSESLIASIDVELPDVGLPYEDVALAPEARRTIPASLAAADAKPVLDLGVMDLTEEFELGDDLLAAIEPVDVQLAEPLVKTANAALAAAPALTAAIESEPVLVLSESDIAPLVVASETRPAQTRPAHTRTANSGPVRHTLAKDLREFDLAQVDSAPSALHQAIELQKPLQAGGMALGNVDLRISGSSTIEIRLSSILTLLQDQMEPELYSRLSTANSAGAYVTFADLRAAGIRINFDPVRDMLTMSTDAS